MEMLACFLRAALSSVLRMKGVDRVGDCNLLRQAVKDLEQLQAKLRSSRVRELRSQKMAYTKYYAT